MKNDGDLKSGDVIEADEVEFRVTDHGPELTEEQENKVNELFDYLNNLDCLDELTTDPEKHKKFLSDKNNLIDQLKLKS